MTPTPAASRHGNAGGAEGGILAKKQKKKRRTWWSRKRRMRRSSPHLKIEEKPTGFQLTARAGRLGWRKLDSFDGQTQPTDKIHICGCPVTGEFFARPIEGRYRQLDDAELKERLKELKEIITDMGGSVSKMPGSSLWWQAEWLENIIEFDLEPPCGCPRNKRVASA